MDTLFSAPWKSYQVNGKDYNADGSGRIDGVAAVDVGALLQAGCTISNSIINFSAGSVSSGLIAAGSSINDATPLPGQYNIIVDSSMGSGVTLPPALSLGSGAVFVYNTTANVINVYSTDELDGSSAGTPSPLLNGYMGFYFSSTADVPTYVSAVVADPRLVPMHGGLNLIGTLIGADMDSVADEPVLMLIGQTPFRIRQITVTNASGVLDTAAGGIYTDRIKGGTAIVSGLQEYSDLTSQNIALDLDIVPTPGNTIWPAGTQLYKSLSTPQGAGASADYYFYGSV